MIQVDPVLPQDMRDLLIRLDTKVDGITNTLARMDRRADDHEHRISTIETELATRPILIKQHEEMIDRVDDLETWRTKAEGQVEGASKMGRAIWAIGAALFLALGYIGYEINVDPQTITSKRVETITAPVITNAN